MTEEEYEQKYNAVEWWEIELVAVTDKNPIMGEGEYTAVMYLMGQLDIWVESDVAQQLASAYPPEHYIIKKYLELEKNTTKNILEYLISQCESRGIYLPNSMDFICRN